MCLCGDISFGYYDLGMILSIIRYSWDIVMVVETYKYGSSVATDIQDVRYDRQGLGVDLIGGLGKNVVAFVTNLLSFILIGRSVIFALLYRGFEGERR